MGETVSTHEGPVFRPCTFVQPLDEGRWMDAPGVRLLRELTDPVLDQPEREALARAVERILGVAPEH